MEYQMKTPFKMLLYWLAVTGFAISTIAVVGATTTVTVPEEEPNDDFETAQVISEANVDGEIVDGDSDFYKIDADTTDAVDVEVVPESEEVIVRLYDGDRNELEEIYVEEGEIGRIVRKLTGTDVHYIEVKGRYSETATAYNLDYQRVTPTENDDFAPNGDFASAPPFSEQSTQQKIWGGESDFYKIDADTTDAVDVEVAPESEEVIVRLYDGGRDELEEIYVEEGEIGRIVRKLTDTDVHYIEVKGRYSQTTTAYTINYDKIVPAENDDFAPNEDFASAAPVTQRSIEAKVWGGESDFYKIEARTGTIKLEVSPESQEVIVRLYDGDRDELDEIYVEEGDIGRIVHKLTDTNVHYIEVKGRYSQTTTAFTLQSNQTTSPRRETPLNDSSDETTENKNNNTPNEDKTDGPNDGETDGSNDDETDFSIIDWFTASNGEIHIPRVVMFVAGLVTLGSGTLGAFAVIRKLRSATDKRES